MKQVVRNVVMAASVVLAVGVSAQDAAPSSVEREGQPVTVNDGGVEVVRAAEDAALAEKPTKPKDALDDVKSWLKGKGWKFNRYDGKKKRLILVVSEAFDCKDPANVKDVMTQRDMATKRAVLQAKAEIIQFVKAEVDAEDIMEMMGANDPSVSESAKQDAKQKAEAFKGHKLTQKSAFAFMAEMPLFGATCIKQSESWNRGKYQIALAMAWSPALERAARAVLTGQNVACAPKANGKEIADWLDACNPAFMSGPIQFVDKDGKRWFLGISAAAADDDLDALTLKANKRIADMSAMQMLVFSLWGDVKSFEQMKQELATTSLDGKSTTETAQWMEQKISQKVKGLPIRGMTRLYNDEVDHPVTGGKIYVSIYGINPSAATEALKIEAVNFMTRAEVERVKTVEQGRAAANKALVEGATNDQKDFQKGQAAQAANLQGETATSATKGTQHVQPKEEATKRVKKSKAGVFSGAADTDDDF